MLFCLLLPAFAFARTTVQDDGTFVLDTAGVVDDATEQALEDYLRELEQKTSDQVKLLTVKTTDGEPFFDFAQRHANLWELGQKGKDNAALLVFALDERQFRIHTYYGMEGILPDAWCGTAFRQLARPKFKAGNYAQGLNDVTLAVINKIAAERGIRVTGAPNVQVRQDRTPPTLPAVLFITILIMIIASVFSGTRRGRRYSRGGWVSSYGGSRGGFGGFGGGGGFSGGSFGGGGISGGGGGGGGW